MTAAPLPEPADDADLPPNPPWFEALLTNLDRVIEQELATVDPDETQAEMDRILTDAGYERDANAGLRRATGERCG